MADKEPLLQETALPNEVMVDWLKQQLDAANQRIAELEGKLKKLAALAGGYAVESVTWKARAEVAESKLEK